MQLSELASIPIVSAARHEQSRFGSPRAVSVITAEEIRRRNFRNVPEAVGTVAGVYLQQTNYGGGSPIIRGMVGNRVLLMVNGIRLNNGTYRLGPNQYLSQIDINHVERIEVVRGAGSVLYGSDAFGGIINVITQAAPDPRNGSETAVSTRVRFGTADSSGTGRIEVSGASGRLGFLGGFTGEEFGDVRAGSDRGIQQFTGYGAKAADLTFTFAVSDTATITGSLSTLRQTDVPRTDVLAAGSDLQHIWDSQGRHLLDMHYTQSEVSRYISTVQISLAYQRPSENLRRIVASDPDTQRRQRDRVDTAEAGVQFTSHIGNSHVLTYGFNGTQDCVSSSRTDVKLSTGAQSISLGNYPDQSRFSDVSIFLQDEVRLAKRFDAVFGVRHNHFWLSADVHDPATGLFKIRSAPSAVTGSAHFLYELTRHVHAVGGVSQGFRAPNVDDASILGGIGSRFEVPNSRLEPERSLNFEYGVRTQGRIGTLSVVGFEDRYRDLIDRAPGILWGLPFRDLNGNGVKDTNEPDVYQRQNISQAKIRGLEVESMLNLADGWTWTHITTWSHGTNSTTGQPLTRIPPLNGTSRITWQSARSVWVEGALVAASSQRRLAPADKTDIRIAPGGTDGYAIVHLRAGLRRSSLAGLSIALENITNRRYRFHGSGIDRPGINLVLGYSRSF